METRLKHFEEDGTRFIDGSRYEGTWNAVGMDGIGTYIFPHNAKFQGEFRDDTFHGQGTAYWPRGQRMDGVWSRGECKQNRYAFADDLIFLKDGWQYCTFPDRRYHLCLKYGLRPAGATLSTNNEKEILMPPLCYDSGIGIFDPATHSIVSYRDPKKVVNIPTTKMARWIMDNCRKAWTEPTGHRRYLHENWFPREPNDANVRLLSSLLPFSKCSSESWWKRITFIERKIVLAVVGVSPPKHRYRINVVESWIPIVRGFGKTVHLLRYSNNGSSFRIQNSPKIPKLDDA